MDDCLFCKIVKEDIPSNTIYEDDIVKVFLDIHPSSVGHTLIISKEHYLDLDDIPLTVLSHIMGVAKDIKKKLEGRLDADGICLIQNNGFIQEVKHYHLHLIPKYRGKRKKISVNEVFEILKGE